MPSFYPRTTSHHLPLTPPDFVPSYNATGCGGAPYQADPYMAQQGMGAHNEAGYNRYAEHYEQTPALITPASGAWTQYNEPTGAPILPPLQSQVHGRPTKDDTGLQYRRQQHVEQSQPPPKEEKVAGGVSSKLDYEMETMTDFVSEMAQGMYALYKSQICIADIDLIRSVHPGTSVHPSFRKWVSQVLCATRLPSATILLSLYYLSVRITMLSKAGPKTPVEGQSYRLLTISMILGSKFLDDNTFINRSWSEVSGIKVAELNRLELEWLQDIGFKLHCDPSEHQGFAAWLTHWKEYKTQAAARSAKASKLAPIDTNIQRHRSSHTNFSPAVHQQLFTKPAVSDYGASVSQPAYNPAAYQAFSRDPWNASATDNSPASAPHTGPATPEYYPGMWAATLPTSVTHSRRDTFGYASSQQSSTFLRQPSYVPQQWHQNVWNNHGHGCLCTYCARHYAPYFMAPGYGAQTVAG
ncbi:hypothetical protein B0A49_03100 [Cryomyces minteri]|uniref:Meiotically up-regulated gene 80 protein n=1 Tax=Cryomyces minteri TaxID=331657 RepID=A0A4V5NH06_9PEZI|nr:hypothetical protein B0A49_03100 [Cryomyces minteri]